VLAEELVWGVVAFDAGADLSGCAGAVVEMELEEAVGVGMVFGVGDFGDAEVGLGEVFEGDLGLGLGHERAPVEAGVRRDGADTGEAVGKGSECSGGAEAEEYGGGWRRGVGARVARRRGRVWWGSADGWAVGGSAWRDIVGGWSWGFVRIL